jgi:ketosteroid isomerase-like protein
VRASLAVCLVLGFPLAAQQPPANLSPERAALWREIQALNDSMVAAFQARPGAVARFYADNAQLVGAEGGPTVGRAAVDAYWARIRNAKGWKLEVLDVGGGRNLAYQVGRSHLTTTDATGRDRTYTTDFVVLWQRQPHGAMRILYDVYN